jgi:NTP pyrophosphatase (non-canonical NTP hydrolase)
VNRIEHLLFTLAEECAEVAQRASKAARFGLDEVQPGQMLTNRERIVQELNDLYAMAEMLDLATVDRTAIATKKDKVMRFMDYAERCGSLQPTSTRNHR